MRQMTDANLKNAYAGESQAHMRYLIFADAAEKDGKANIARLWRAIAYAEQVHATNHFKTLGLLHTTTENLQTSIDGEVFESEEMYPAYDKVAELQAEDKAKRSVDWAWEAEKIHAKLFDAAKATASAGQDTGGEAVYVCEVCGHTVLGEAPDKCPICGAKKEKYRKF